ncbi:MAG: lytic transglycosylase domain-containing protein [Alphaproteobacteria bacterium]|nr:lytic transglycosylase domain-containing protein [Alphaproteobacteria bacterium]MBV9151326.1 lytic transglycosylase domain-containing protein [Alphaproteobacteria bacterium]
MFAVFRLLFIVFGIFVSLITTSRAEDNADAAEIAAITAARSGDWPQAYAKAGQVRDGGLTAKIVRWLDYTRPTTAGGHFSELAAFIDQNPDWPLQKRLQRRAEEALTGESDQVAAAWFKRHPAIGGVGKARAAQILLNRGNNEAGTAAIRAAWVDGDFTVADEHSFLARYSGMLRPEDHQKRLDRLIWDGLTDAARHMLPLVSADYRLAAEARLALAADAPNGEALLAKVPSNLRSDPGVAFEEARWRRKKNQYDAAAQLLLAHAESPVRPTAWWAERQLVARQLLASGNTDTAYKLAQQHGLTDGYAYSEAEFLSGFIALRYQKDPALALDHFTRILARVNTPYGKSRAAYWSGRAAEAAGDSAAAAKWYAAGAEHMATFYGQLAAHQLGKDAPPRPVPEPQPNTAEQKHFDAEEMVRVAKLLFAAGDRDHARSFVMQMAELAKTPVAFEMLASLAEAQGRIDLAIAIAKRSIEAGTPLMVHGYPVTPLPTGGTAERSLLFAIVRQESGFASEAMSRVGARGLMQLMPATAAGLAGKLQLPYSLDRLTADGVYNLTLGRSYVENLIDEFGGSYPLAIAAYNAGPGRVRQWLHEFGDPRGRDISMVDWIEMIPFNETRLYVQRVLENLQIYRGQDTNNAAAFSLASDLAR